MNEPNTKAAPIPQSEVTRVKALGFLWDKRTQDRFNGRVITRNGKITAEECHIIAEAAKRFGSGEVAMTTRLTMEIQGVPFENIEPLRTFLREQAGLETGGTGAKDGFMAGFNLIPAVMFFCGLLGVFEQLGAFKASDILFRPLLRPLLGIPGKCGIAFISSFTGSDVAAVMTRELYESGDITDDERTIFVAYQYAGSACINNTITGGAPLVAICPVALGPCILIMVLCKLIGANVVRIILRLRRKKA